MGCLDQIVFFANFNIIPNCLFIFTMLLLNLHIFEKILFKVVKLSTNIFPVDEPINIFKPGMFLKSTFKTSSILLFDAPKKMKN